MRSHSHSHSHALVATLERASAIGLEPPTLAITVYAAKIISDDMGPYNISALASLVNSIFVMGYDLTWLRVPVGQGWKQAGPNAPLDGESVSLFSCVCVPRISCVRSVVACGLHSDPDQA